MAETSALSIIESINNNMVAQTMNKINAFQAIIQSSMVPAHDIGIIPGTSKPTLLKPGAEKICMMMGLSSRFEIMDKVEDYEKGFFAYNVRCTLSRDELDICEGVGHCNSRERKYAKEDPYSITNTVLKMAKKRAYVDATLSVASLSNIFTQDLEDLPDMMIKKHGPSASDNQGKNILDQEITFGKHKGRTFGDLVENETDYLKWLSTESQRADQRALAQQALDAGAAIKEQVARELAAKTPPTSGPDEDPAAANSKAIAEAIGQPPEDPGIPPAVLRMANDANWSEMDLHTYCKGKFGKPFGQLKAAEKSEVTKFLSSMKNKPAEQYQASNDEALWEAAQMEDGGPDY